MLGCYGHKMVIMLSIVSENTLLSVESRIWWCKLWKIWYVETYICVLYDEVFLYIEFRIQRHVAS